MSKEQPVHYDAADIERYYNGQMTVAERHALEKAALDDPFLADAMEGYSSRQVNVHADMNELNKRLDERTGKVVPIKKSRYAWLRIAALLLLMISGGLLTYNYFFANRKNDVAIVETKERAANKDSITSNQQANESKNDSPAATKDTNRAEDAASKQSFKSSEFTKKEDTNFQVKQKPAANKKPGADIKKINLDKVQGLSVVSDQQRYNK
jgi:hypothetical protein